MHQNDPAGIAPGQPTPAAYEALASLYNALMTGLVLSLISRRGEDLARDFVQAHFRRQHHEKFLPGLRKLGLDNQPHAVACALYHYHSNALGGVKTEYHYENDRKAWVRYPPPRWIWRGTAVCAVPHSVNIAMLHGWHAHNGVTLNNPRLGFVCTGTITSGQPGLEGYYYEYDRPLAPEERLRFVEDERMPRIDPATQPKLDTAGWPEERLRKTYRSYAMEYMRSMAPTLMSLIGSDAAAAEIGRTARLIGMQFYDEVAAAMGLLTDDRGPGAFKTFLGALLAAHGERVTFSTERTGVFRIAITGWRLMDRIVLTDAERAAAFAAWNQLWVGAGLAHDRHMQVAADWMDTSARWTIGN